MLTMITNVNSQELLLNYADGDTPLTLDQTNGNQMTINPTSGDITVFVTEDKAAIGTGLGLAPVGNAPDISFNVTLNGAATQASINANITDDAVYCLKNGLWATSSLSSLTTSNPPSTFVTSVTGVGTSNSTNYSLTCANSFGKTTKNTTVSGITATVNPVVLISASNSSVNSGGSSTITWSVTNAPTSCTFSGANNQWPSGITHNGPFSFVVNNITSAQTYSILCDNAAAGNSGTISTTISIATSAACVNFPPPPSPIYEDTTIRATPSSGGTGTSYNGQFSNLFDGSGVHPWPGTTGNRMKLTIDQDSYVAATFTTPNIGQTGQLSSIPITSVEGPAAFGQTWTISECPGDFNHHLGQVKCRSNGILRWSTQGTDPASRCQLDPNTSYYLNLIHSTTVDTTYSSTCFSSFCGFLGDSTSN